MNSNLKWSGKAQKDIISIKKYIEKDNPQAAVDLTKKIVLKVVEQLSEFKNIGKAGRLPGTRELVIANTPYIAIYRVKGGSIEVLRILHTSLMWPDTIEK